MAKSAGGLKGLIQSTGKAVYSASVLARDYGTVAARWSYRFGGGLAFVLATTSMIVLMPLMFESSREVTVRGNAKPRALLHVKLFLDSSSTVETDRTNG